MPTDRQSWRDVRDHIRDAILQGRYSPGDKLPRDADIADTLDCARSTVQRAMQDLSDAGLIERRRKGGTRVRPDPVTRATLDIPVIRREVEQTGRRHHYQLLSRRRKAAPPPVMAALGLPEPAPMLHVIALHFADAAPFVVEDRWISLDTVPEIIDVDLTRESANEWLLQNRRYSRGDLQFRAEPADAATAELLGTPTGAALFVTERTTWIGNDPITHVKTTAAPGYRLRTEI